MERAGSVLIHFLWEAAVVALVLRMMLTVALRPELRCRLAEAALGLLMLLPVATFWALRAPEPLGAAATMIEPSAGSPWPSLPAASGDWTTALTALWMAWVAVQSVRWAGGWWLTRHYPRGPLPAEWDQRVAELAQAMGLRIRAWVSSVPVPQVIGVVRPVLLIPASALTGLSPEQMEAILVHELAHILRRDHWVNAALAAAEILLGFHPAVAWVTGVIRREREFCCDEFAARWTRDPRLCAEALFHLESAVVSGWAVAANGGRLGERVSRLIRPVRSGIPWQAPSLVLAGALGVTVLSVLQGPATALSVAAPDAKLSAAVSAQSAAPRPEPRPSPGPRMVDGGPPEELRQRIAGEIRRAAEIERTAEIERAAAALARLQAEEETGRAQDLERQLIALEATVTAMQKAADEVKREADRVRAAAQVAQRDAESARQKADQEQKAAEERKRRIAYARERFGGEATPRGTVYVRHGPPDEIESHPAEGREVWLYRTLPGEGSNVKFRFEIGEKKKGNDQQ